MKKILTLSLLAFLLFFGCTDNIDNTIVSTHTPTAFNKSGPELFGSSGEINGAIGGELILDSTYINSQGRQINIHARLKFPAGSFQGTINIEMIPNVPDLSIQLFPDMTFNEIVKLDLVYTGVDLEAMGYTASGHVDFVYFSENGDIELLQNQGSNLHLQQQRIGLRGGKLSHFSRYGWIR